MTDLLGELEYSRTPLHKLRPYLSLAHVSFLCLKHFKQCIHLTELPPHPHPRTLLRPPCLPLTLWPFAFLVYDPAVPIPTVGGGNLVIKPCGPEDQTKVENRADVLKFTSDALTDHVAVTGKISVVLFVSSTAVDTDFVVKVCLRFVFLCCFVFESLG
jgi:hypothetical protein